MKLILIVKRADRFFKNLSVFRIPKFFFSFSPHAGKKPPDDAGARFCLF